MARPLAIVTGASAGIGAALARVIAADGYDLLLIARRQDRLDALAGELATEAHTFALDLTESTAADTLARHLGEQGFRPNVLVNNAGFGAAGPFGAADRERQLGMIDLNVRSLVGLTHRLLPTLQRDGAGGILNLASTAAFQPGPNFAVYYATKAFVLSFSEALSQELRGEVTVTALCPGPTQSEFGAVAGMENSRLFRWAVRMTAEDVAKIGWRGFRRGRRVVVPGLTNKAGAALAGLVPHNLILPVVEYLQSDLGKRPR